MQVLYGAEVSGEGFSQSSQLREGGWQFYMGTRLSEGSGLGEDKW